MAFSTEIDQLVSELEMMRAEQERTDAIVSGWTRSGETDPYFSFFRANTGHFDTIPHPAASVLSVQTSRASATTFSTFSGWTTASNNAGVWSFEVQVESSNGLITPKNQPEDSIWSFTAWTHWSPSSAGVRGLGWFEKDSGNSVRTFEFSPSSVHDTYLDINHFRRAAAADTAYEIRAFQDSGSSLVMNLALFTAHRVR